MNYLNLLQYLNITPYKYLNKNNIFNFIIVTYDCIPDNMRQEYINNIKLIIGLSFTEDLKYYLFKKFSEHELLKKL